MRYPGWQIIMRLFPIALLLTTSLAQAQVGDAPRRRVRYLPTPQTNLLREAPAVHGRQAESGIRPVIMVTGYWAPTNGMLRAFSTSPVQNPVGWIGENWEGRGYDIHAYFPEFPAGSGGQGMGDLEVDYQDTTADFRPLADGVDPVAIVTFSRGLTDESWEVEFNQRNLVTWIDDYTAPFQPTPAPPDASKPAGHVRISTLPVQEIADFVDLANLGVNPFVNFMGNGGGFLSEFVAYQGVWYQGDHTDPMLPDWCLAAGHVHVGGLNNLLTSKRATKATLRRLIHYVDNALDSETGQAQFFCEAAANSTNIGAQLTMTGSVSLARNDLELIVTHAITSNFGLLFYGPGQQTPALFGNGSLCVSGPLHRVLPATVAGVGGFVSLPLDLQSAPFNAGSGAITTGSSWFFQYWYRDPAAGGAAYNASSALGLTFLP
ncbi:MAG: hypothetical protein ACI8QC_000375 [Planctomycetota bacterium]|jgi:hypothetical protein